MNKVSRVIVGVSFASVTGVMLAEAFTQYRSPFTFLMPDITQYGRYFDISDTNDSVRSSFGFPAGMIATHGANNGLVGVTINDAAPSTHAFPAGISGYGSVGVRANGNQAFGVYGLGELRAASGVALGAEFTAGNFSGNQPDTNLPPRTGFGTTTVAVTGANFTCRASGTNDCSIGGYISNENGNASDPVFNTAWYLALFRQYGLFIGSQPSGSQMSEVIQNNGNGTHLLLQTTGAQQPHNSVLTVNDNTGNHFSVRQNGAVYSTGKMEFSQPSRPTISSCGTYPSANKSTDQAGVITVGSGARVTSCTINFATAFNNTPSCTVTGENVSGLVITYKRNTLITVGSTSSFARSNFDYTCIDQN